MITITDTAIAAKRPPSQLLYDTLAKLGAPATMDRLGYRMPFALIGVKGAAPGTANCAQDKTKILLRLEADIVRAASGVVGLHNSTCERTDIAALMLTEGS